MLRLALGLALAVAGCPASLPDTKLVDASHADTPAAEAPLSDESLYHLDAVWTDQNGESVALSDFRGRPVLLAMVYANCGTACPLLVRDMVAVGAALAPADPASVQFVLVSLDPERDSPEQLSHFALANGLGAEWTLLRGTPDDVRTLAALLGVRYRAEADGQIAHSNLITLLDPGGDIVARQQGLGGDPAETVEALSGLLASAQ